MPIKLSPALSKLPRVQVYSRPAKNLREAMESDKGFNCTTLERCWNAFHIKKHMLKK